MTVKVMGDAGFGLHSCTGLAHSRMMPPALAPAAAPVSLSSFAGSLFLGDDALSRLLGFHALTLP
jgi:hypothetical protein